MRNKILISISVVSLLVIGSIILIVMSSADDEKLKGALREAGINEVSQEVYTDRPIAKGQVITEQDVYETQIPVNEARADAFLCKADVIGKRAVGAMEQGQQLAVQDLGLNREDVLKEEISRLKNRGAINNAFCAHSVFSKVRIPEKNVFKAKRSIAEGERIKAEDIEIISSKDCDTNNCSSDIRLVVNRMVKYGLEEGQLLSIFDFVTVGKEGEEDAFVATRDLKPGDIVSASDIAKKHFEKNKCSVNAILEPSLIQGSKVVQPIAKGQVFRVIDLQAAASK